ncbi:FtsX-like permease family protein [Accumulibacter sp.]|uniref:FtsX-like permease family protein n=1 Tax=Accumulibacter sp. TaxID=2053492 RepID=UPI0025EF8FC9|nr:FtsX-like permease family protein [Accumulibacter sp.]MCM8595548.1 ABC transporter permease [Accumulibacter sp.]MCM8627280.1 ABC transporter permease [Accumulibacter sp.]MDS4049696.1 FtsX-like permease family protein [Accumulibacter sp.]
MRRLAWWLIAAQFRTRRTATLLSLLAIALGVALGYAIHLINDAALADFARAMNTVQGDPDVVLAASDSAGSVPLGVLDELARDPAVEVVAAVIDTRVRVDGTATPLRLLGIDAFSAAAVMPRLLPRPADDSPAGGILGGRVYASPALLEQLGLRAGDALTLRRGDRHWPTVVGGELPGTGAGDRLLVADIAWVQAHFGPNGAVSEGRIRLTPETDPARWQADHRPRLPVGLLLRAADDEGRRVANLSRAYRVNLNVLALVALLTGAFLVFATQLTAVAQRSTQFALLGVLGLAPRMRLLQVLLEALAIGLPGALLGLGIGYALALAFTQILGGDLGGGFFSTSSPLLVPRAAPALGFLGLGCAASLGGALYPAWLNRRQPLAQALKTGFAQNPGAHGHRFWRLPLLFALLVPAAFGLTRLPAISGLPLAGYAAIAVVLIVGVAAAPWLTRTVFGLLSRRSLSPPLQVAVQNVAQAPLMAQVAASGLIVSFALTASMVIMVASFRSAVDQWLDHVLPAPLYLRSKGTPLPQALLDAVDRADAPFARVERTAHGSLTLDAQRPALALIVREIDRRDPGTRLPFTGPLFDAAPGEVVIWISEAVEEIYRLRPGERRRLPLLGGDIEVFVGGVWRDYARQFGAVVIAREDYTRLGGDFAPTDLALWPRSGDEAEALRWLAPFTAAQGLEVSTNGELRALSLSIFDRSFAVTHALEAAAMLIGLFGLAVTLAASVWLRARELATLGALGFDRRMLGRAVMLEGLLIAAIGLLIGLACGLAIGAILTQVVNPQAFHWRMPLDVPVLALLAGVALTLAAALLASRHAARQATRLPLAQVLASAQ